MIIKGRAKQMIKQMRKDLCSNSFFINFLMSFSGVALLLYATFI